MFDAHWIAIAIVVVVVVEMIVAKDVEVGVACLQHYLH
jgi:hypothetical protein